MSLLLAQRALQPATGRFVVWLGSTLKLHDRSARLREELDELPPPPGAAESGIHGQTQLLRPLPSESRRPQCNASRQSPALGAESRGGTPTGPGRSRCLGRYAAWRET